MAVTETNMAYDTADYLRVQNLDFVVGIEIRLSNNHTCLGKDGKPHAFHDICDELAGKYPKTFKFVGWHPFCRCISTTILKTDDEIIRDMDGIDRGSVNEVKDYPAAFKQWVTTNQGRIYAAEENGTLPYFLRENEGFWKTTIVSNSDETITLGGVVSRIPNADFASEYLTDNQMKIYKALAEGKSIIDINNLSYELMGKTSISIMNASSSDGKLSPILSFLQNSDIASNPITETSKNASQRKLISRISGGDTMGCCSSLAFAYIGGKCGYKVLDFRGGESRIFFGQRFNIENICKSLGGRVEWNTNDFVAAKKLLSETQTGKQYYFQCSSHAAIIRRTPKGQLQYLNLQNPDMTKNGFIDLTIKELISRFRCKTQYLYRGEAINVSNCLIDIDLFKKNSEFREMLTYINTPRSEQIKDVMKF